MGKGKEPLDHGEPAAKLPCIRVRDVKVNRLVIIDGRQLIRHEGEVGVDSGKELRLVQVPVKPPAGILVPYQKHYGRWQRDEAGEQEFPAPLGCGPYKRKRGDEHEYNLVDQYDEERDYRCCQEKPEKGAQPVELVVRIVDSEFEGVAAGLLYGATSVL